MRVKIKTLLEMDIKEKIKLLLAASGALDDFIPPTNQHERNLTPIIIAVLAWLDGDERALRPWPNIARFFAVRKEPPSPLQSFLDKNTTA
jgi:hypothetical protein